MKPGFHFITRSCTQRQFLLRPDAETNNAFIYCLLLAAQMTKMALIGTIAMSNHHHTVIYDRHARWPEFIEHFHKLLARCLNVHRKRVENFWSSEQVCVVHLAEPSDVIAKLVYLATNPVNDHLVERVHQWPGVNSWLALRANKPLEATRPKFFFRDSMPERVSLELVVPPELGMTREALVEVIERRIAEIEAEKRAERLQTGKPVIGRKQVLAQSYTSSPKTPRAFGGLRPRIAAQNKWARIEAIGRNREFIVEYRQALLKWRKGEPVAFPPGTYWLQRFGNVTVRATS